MSRLHSPQLIALASVVFVLALPASQASAGDYDVTKQDLIRAKNALIKWGNCLERNRLQERRRYSHLSPAEAAQHVMWDCDIEEMYYRSAMGIVLGETGDSEETVLKETIANERAKIEETIRRNRAARGGKP